MNVKTGQRLNRALRVTMDNLKPRRLQGMTPLHAAAALTAPPNVDVELPVNGLARDLDLVLVGDMRLLDRPAAVGAGPGQARLVDLVDVGRGLPMGLGP